MIIYGEIIQVNRTDAVNLTGTITNYTYYLVENSTLEETFLNDTLLKPINYTAVNKRSGYYYIKVITKTSDNLTSISLSDYFRIQSNLIEPCNELYTQNTTGAIAYFNWTTDTSITNIEIYAYNNPAYRVYLTSSIGYVNLLNLTDNLYTLYFNTTNNDTTTEYYSSGCTLEICVNNWVRQVYPCVSSLKYINYTDTNSCPLQYYPANTGTYEDCSLPPATDKNLWLIIVLFVFFLVLLFIGLKYPYAYIGCLIVSIFLSVEMLSYFDEYKVIIMLLFPVITIIFGVFSFLINGRN
jgi:hypothetical protein